LKIPVALFRQEMEPVSSCRPALSVGASTQHSTCEHSVDSTSRAPSK